MFKINSLKPLPPYVLVKRLEPESKVSPDSKLILPGVQNYKNRRCEVLAVHSGKKFDGGKVIVGCSVKPGDLVEVIVFDGEDLGSGLTGMTGYEMVREENILARVAPESDNFIPSTLHKFGEIDMDKELHDLSHNDSLGG